MINYVHHYHHKVLLVMMLMLLLPYNVICQLKASNTAYHHNSIKPTLEFNYDKSIFSANNSISYSSIDSISSFINNTLNISMSSNTSSYSLMSLLQSHKHNLTNHPHIILNHPNKHILFITLFAFSILFIWILLIICAYCNCCLFSNKLRYGKCANVSFWLTYLPFITIIAFTYMFYSKLNILNTYLLGNADTFRNFLTYMQNGGNNVNGFIGVNEINKYLNGTVSFINQVTSSSELIFNKEKYDTLYSKVKQIEEIVNELNKVKDTVLYLDDKEIVPLYAKEFNLNDNKSSLSKIQKEFNSNLNKSFKSLDNVYKKILTLIGDDDNNYAKGINEINDGFYSTNRELIYRKELLFDNSTLLFAIGLSKGLTTIKFLFGGFVFILLANLLLLFIFVYIRDTTIKCILHVSWNIMIIIIFILILSSSIMCFISQMARDIIPEFHSILINVDDNVYYSKYMNSCLNEEGNLYKASSLDKYNFNSLNEIINQIHSNINNITTGDTTQIIPEVLDHISTSFDSDFSKSTDSTYNELDINYILDNLTSITNNINGNAPCETFDIWVSTISKCGKDGYDYKPKDELSERNKGCMLVQDFKGDDSLIEDLYANVCDKPALKYLKQIVTSLALYHDQNEDTLTSIESTLDLLKKTYNDVVYSVNAYNRDIQQKFVFDYQIKQIDMKTSLDCNKAKEYLGMFYGKVSNELSDICNQVSIGLLLSGVIGLIGMLFMIGTIYRTSEEAMQKYYNHLNENIQKREIELIDQNDYQAE